MVFKGGQPGPAGSIDGEIEDMGGLLEATTDRDWTHFEVTVASRYVGKTLGVVASALSKAQFRPEDFEAEKPLILEEIGRIRTDPEAAIATTLYQLAYQKHPYRLDPRGNARFINGLDLKAVRAYYQKYYVPANMTVVVVGDVDPAAVERDVRTAFHADQAGPKTEQKLPPDERACATAERKVINTGFANGFVGLAYPAPSVKDAPDVYAMDLILTLLENGSTGRLPRLLRDQGAVDVSFETRRQPGVLTVIAMTQGGAVEQTEGLLRNEIDLLRTKPVSADELAYAKRELRGSFILDNEPYSGQASTLGYYDMIDRWQFAAGYLAQVEAVTPEQLQSVAAKYLTPEHVVSLILKPGEGAPSEPPRSRT
jgi:zinc protease